MPQRKQGAEKKAIADNVELDEAVWQKWVNKNKERDAARRSKLIRVLWLAVLLFLFGTVVWLLVGRGGPSARATLYLV